MKVIEKVLLGEFREGNWMRGGKVRREGWGRLSGKGGGGRGGSLWVNRREGHS